MFPALLLQEPGHLGLGGGKPHNSGLGEKKTLFGLLHAAVLLAEHRQEQPFAAFLKPGHLRCCFFHGLQKLFRKGFGFFCLHRKSFR